MRIVPAQQENGGRGRHGGEEVGIAFGPEVELHGEHVVILAFIHHPDTESTGFHERLLCIRQHLGN